MKELVDMANLYLVSAEKLAKEAKEVGNYAEKPLACIMLSCCALEAFINQAISYSSSRNGRFSPVDVYSQCKT